LDFTVGAGRFFSQQLIKGCNTYEEIEDEKKGKRKRSRKKWDEARPQPAWDSLTS
jgi:hypothetical protein